MTCLPLKTKTVIRLMIVDDHPAFRDGLATMLDRKPGFAVVAEAGDGLAAVELFRRFRPDVVLMDLRLPGMSGVEAIINIRKEFPAARVIVLTTYDADEDVYRAIQSGAQSYLLKEVTVEEILRTIRAVHAGEPCMPQSVTSLLNERQKRGDLEPAEMKVLDLLARGRSNKEIADMLQVTEAVVKNRLKNLFVKLGARDRTEAVVNALRQGIVHLE